MTEYVLQITLQSPLTSAAGEGRVGVVDRDIAFNDLGIPILPGRRLKGLWREAYRDVADAWTLCGKSPMPAEHIFGKSGQKPGDGDAFLYVANAELQEAASLREWLKYLQHYKIKKLHPDDVVQYFATVRTQTAIDRMTGASLENTLRLTRTLKTGLVFRARVRFFGSPDQEMLNVLSLGAAALQHMGTARTRGLGKVSCRLLAYDQNGNHQDLTEQVLNNNGLPSITATNLAQPAQTSKGQTTVVPPSNRPVPTHLLRYRIKLTAPAVIPMADGDPNTVMTRRDVPGSNIWGVAAYHYLSQPNHTPKDDAFRHAFLDGNLRFITAYPEAYDPDDFNEIPQTPIPHSIRKYKEYEKLVDFVEQSPGAEPTKRLDHRYARISQDSLKTQAVKTELNYHHARAKDRRKGRALGAKVPNGGAFFTYEAIEAGQSFQGAVLGSENDLKSLQKWLQGGQIRIGRSRSAQYGEAEFEWLDDAPQELNGRVEWDGFVEQQTPDVMTDWSDGNLEEGGDGFIETQAPDVADSGKCLIITTLSPLLTVNDYGHPEAFFPLGELTKALGLKTPELRLCSSYTRTEVIGGYNSHLRLARQQWPAIAPGSVFVFKAEKTLDQKKLLQLEHNGLGLRKGEGYGCIAVNRHGSLGLTGCTETQLDDPDEQDIPKSPDSEIPQSVQDLLLGVVRERCLAEIQQRAMMVAGETQQVPRSNALLGRLRLFLQQDKPVDSLNSLRKPAREGLMDCRINTRDMSWLSDQTSMTSMTLYDLFEKAWTDPKSLTQELIKSRAEELLIEDRYADSCQTMIDKLVADDSAKMCIVFLDHLLTALRRKNR